MAPGYKHTNNFIRQVKANICPNLTVIPFAALDKPIPTISTAACRYFSLTPIFDLDLKARKMATTTNECQTWFLAFDLCQAQGRPLCKKSRLCVKQTRGQTDWHMDGQCQIYYLPALRSITIIIVTVVVIIFHKADNESWWKAEEAALKSFSHVGERFITFIFEVLFKFVVTVNYTTVSSLRI